MERESHVSASGVSGPRDSPQHDSWQDIKDREPDPGGIDTGECGAGPADRKPTKDAAPSQSAVSRNGSGSGWPERGSTHVLANIDSMEDLQQPIRATARIKYTCLTVSDHLIIMGTNTGVVYVFNQGTQRYIHMLPGDQEGSVVKMSISPSGHLLGYATSMGKVLVVKLHADQRSKPDRLRTATDHKGAVVLAMCWNSENDRLFVGDDNGKVSVINFYNPSSKARGLLRPMTETILKLDSAVVQIDTFNDKVIVSTRTRTYLSNTTTKQFSHIGKRPRDGQYGSCFSPSNDGETAIIYCSRPGSRVWEVDYMGEVLNTHQFKHLLDVPPLPIVETRNSNFHYPTCLGEGPGPLSVNFPNLLRFAGQYLLSWTMDTLYILDPIDVRVVMWNDQIKGITDVHCKGDEIYILKEDSSVLKFRLIPIPKLVASIFHQRKWTLCAELVLCFIKPLSGASKWRCVSRAMLSDLRRHIVDDVVRSKLDMVVSQMVNRDDFIDDQSDVSTIPSPSQAHFANYELLDTGIYVIKNKYAPTRHCEQRLQQPVSEGTYLQDENNSQPKRSLQEVPKGHISNGNQNIRDMNQGDIAMATKGLGASSNEADQRSGYLTTTSHKDASSTGTTVSNDGLLPRRRSSENLNDQDESRSPQTSQHPSSASNSVTAEISNKDTCWSQHAEQDSVDAIRGRMQNLKGRKLQASTILLETTTSPVADQSSMHPGYGSAPLLTIPQVGSSPPTARSSGSPAEHLDRETNDKMSSDVLQTKCIAKEPSTETTTVLSRKLKLLAVKDRISTRVKTTTKSVIQNFRDKKSQLARKVVYSPAGRMGRLVRVSVVPAGRPSPIALKTGPGDEETTQIQRVPTVDTTELETATRRAREQMQDVWVLYDPASARQVLTSWLGILHQTLHSLHSAIMQEHIQQLAADLGTVQDEAGPLHTHSSDKDNIDSDGPTDNLNICKKDEPYSVEATDSLFVDNHRETMMEEENITRCTVDVEKLGQDDHKVCSSEKVPSASETLHHDLAADIDDLSVNVNNTPKENLTPDAVTLDSSSSSERGRCRSENLLKTDGQKHVSSGILFKDMQYLSDPFALPADIHSKAAALAELCWFFRCHGSVSKYVFPDKGAETNKSTASGSETFSSHPNIGISSCPDEQYECPIEGLAVFHPKWYTGKMLTQQDVESEEEDKELAMFLQCYFHLFLGSVNKVHETITTSRGSRFHRWRSLVNCLIELSQDDKVTKQIMQQEPQAAIDILRSEISPQNYTILAHIVRLYGMVPLKTLEFCAEVNRYISPLDVLYMTCMGSKVDSHFLFYMKRLLGTNDQTLRGLTLAEVCSDTEVCRAFLQCLLGHKPPDLASLSCSCGMPRPGAHRLRWQEAFLVDQVLDLPSTAGWMKDITRTHGYWSGYLKLCLRDGEREAHLMAALQLGDLRLLTKASPLGAVPDSTEAWEKLLLWKKQLCGMQRETMPEVSARGHDTYKMFCLKCGADLYHEHVPISDESKDQGCLGDRPVSVESSSKGSRRKNNQKSNNSDGKQDSNWMPDVTWENLAEGLVETLGAVKGLELLEKVARPDQALSVGFYRGCVASTLIEKKQNYLVKKMLEKMDTYPWSVRPTNSLPQVTIHYEEQDVCSPLAASPTEKLFVAVSPQGAHGRVVVKKMGREAGVNKKGVCACCSLPYGASVLYTDPGVVVFTCGHGFHKSCATSDSCPVCLSDDDRDSG